MTVSRSKIFNNNSSGASILEVLLAMAIIAVAAPFVYNQISRTNQTISDITTARHIMSVRDDVLNFIRMNQDKWPDVAQIKLDETELATISPDAAAGFVDKYAVNGAFVTDVYLAFELSKSQINANKIARHIGGDAAVVGDDSVAYGNTWAVSAPDFISGDLIYRISRDVSGEDTSKYLHRGTSGEDGLNVMQRDLDMAHHHIYNVATIFADSARIKNANTTFVTADDVFSDTIYFSSGANIDGQDVTFGDLRVSGDMSGFRNVRSARINDGNKFTTSGRVISDRVSITDKINIGNNLVLKSDTSNTISGFTGVAVNSVIAPFISAEEMIFYENFGLTVSGELLMSTTSPIKIGKWVFPSTKPPQFSKFTLSRAETPSMPSRNAFGPLMRSGWQETISAPNTIQSVLPQ